MPKSLQIFKVFEYQPINKYTINFFGYYKNNHETGLEWFTKLLRKVSMNIDFSFCLKIKVVISFTGHTFTYIYCVKCSEFSVSRLS